MTNYFSQLARQTGLRFTNTASRSKAVAPIAPLHVEEVTMVSPATSIADAPAPTTHEPAPHATVTERFEADTQVTPISDERPPTEIQAIEQESVQSAATEQPTTFATDDTDVKQDRDGSRVERVEVEPVPHAPTPPSTKAVEVSGPGQRFDFDEKEKIEPAATPNSSEVEFSNPVEREVLVRQYLREVRAWVAASPTTDESVAETQSWTDPKPESIAFTVERESIPALAQPELREPLDVHDMNLSIGNISIVIEEPKPAAATVIAPPPSAPSTQPQTQHEPVSLSRYYLRSW